MKIQTGNYLVNEITSKIIVKHFQNSAYQLLYGNYIDDMYKKEGEVLSFTAFQTKYGKQVSIMNDFDISYYRITSTECSTIVQYLNSGLELICGVETICEEEGF